MLALEVCLAEGARGFLAPADDDEEEDDALSAAAADLRDAAALGAPATLAAAAFLAGAFFTIGTAPNELSSASLLWYSASSWSKVHASNRPLRDREESEARESGSTSGRMGE